MKEALRDGGQEYDVAVVPDGAVALDYLCQHGAYDRARVPDLIFLDLNLPKKSGSEVLGQIKKDERLRFIPVVIFSSSAAPQDVTQAYQLHANCYVTKPADVDELFNTIRLIERFWLKAVTLPASRG